MGLYNNVCISVVLFVIIWWFSTKFQGRMEKCLSFSILLINNLSHSVCLSASVTHSFHFSLCLSVLLSFSLSVLGRVFLPRPLMASFSTSSIQAWPSPLKNTALSLVPLATTQVQGWWTSSLSTHFLHVHLLGHIYGIIGSGSNLVFPQ